MPKPALSGGQPAFEKLVPVSNPGFFPNQSLMEKVSGVLESGVLSKGIYVEQFESECAEFLEVEHVIALSSCLSGLILCMRALELTGEVIVPSFTFPAAPGAIVQCGLTPVFADCDPETFNIDPQHAESLITDQTSAIMAVANYGLPPDIDRLKEITKKHGIKLIFDSAQGFGAKYKGRRMGGFGSAEVFSLSQSKILTACEGGLVATNNDSIAEKVRQGRNYGKGDSGEFLFEGQSSRLSEVHALIGLELLKAVPDFLKKRKKLVKLYRENLAKIKGIGFQGSEDDIQSSECFFPVFVDQGQFGLTRDQLQGALLKENMETWKLFSPPCHQHRAFEAYQRAPLPYSKKAAEECLTLPLYPSLNDEEVKLICKVVGNICSHKKKR